jgi:hypothetical protein
MPASPFMSPGVSTLRGVPQHPPVLEPQAVTLTHKPTLLAAPLLGGPLGPVCAPSRLYAPEGDGCHYGPSGVSAKFLDIVAGDE